MATNNIKQSLMKLGLSETESRVYLAMLKLGADTIQHIAREAKISRTAAYEIISALEKKGLASTFTQGKRKNFVAEDPEKLESYFEQRIRDVQTELSSFSRILPEIRLMQGGGDKPRVRYYKGEEGIRAIFRDLDIMHPKELLEFANVDAVYALVDPKLLLEVRQEYDYKHIETKVLYRGSIRNVSPGVEYRKLASDALDFQGDVWIYGNRIAFIHFVGKIEVVIVDNQLFADTMRAMFMAAWTFAANDKK